VTGWYVFAGERERVLGVVFSRLVLAGDRERMPGMACSWPAFAGDRDLLLDVALSLLDRSMVSNSRPASLALLRGGMGGTGGSLLSSDDRLDSSAGVFVDHGF
jgi:hypothetical protein